MHTAETLAPLADDMRAVNSVIRARLRSDIALVNTVSEYIIAAGGKRLRPALLLLVSGAFGYSGPYRHEMAAVVEFIHTATLLHDDVVDESSLRRGRSTANAEFGNAAAVLVGDFLYSRAFQMMVEPGRMRIMEILSEATNVIAEGEVLQLMNVNDPDISEANYLQVIRYKTAKLFEASAQLGAVLADAGPDAEASCAAFGRHLGTAFQLVDDVLDYSGATSETGKSVGDDLREGKTTMPLIYLRDHGTSTQRAFVRQALELGPSADIEQVVTTLQSSGALDYTRECARREAALAADSIEALPAGPNRSALIELCALASVRSA